MVAKPCAKASCRKGPITESQTAIPVHSGESQIRKFGVPGDFAEVAQKDTSAGSAAQLTAGKDYHGISSVVQAYHKRTAHSRIG